MKQSQHTRPMSGLLFLFPMAAIVLIVAIAAWYSYYQPPRSHAQPHPTLHVTQDKQATPVPAATRPVVTSTFETGMVYPRWSTQGYGPLDTAFTQALPALSKETRARWLEMPLLFKQATPASLSIDTSGAPTVNNFAAGIALAHEYGYHVFIVPLLTVSVPGGWAGMVHPLSISAWFSAYWQAYKPYIQVAQAYHAEQLAIGTELSWVQQNASDGVWQSYIEQVRGMFSGSLTYDLNWPDISQPIHPWMRMLDTLGVSEYMPEVDRAQRVAPSAMSSLFKTMIQPRLDDLAARYGKPIIISEIGYRASGDALWQTWDATVHGARDEQEQAGALSAALACLTHDKSIQGVFVWGWLDSGAFSIAGNSAAVRAVQGAYSAI